jgi:high-affinity iron transporter
MHRPQPRHRSQLIWSFSWFPGLSAAVVLGWTLFFTTNRLSLRGCFKVTNLLLILFAAGLVASGVHELNQAGWILSVIEHVWDIDHILDQNSQLFNA